MARGVKGWLMNKQTTHPAIPSQGRLLEEIKQ